MKSFDKLIAFTLLMIAAVFVFINIASGEKGSTQLHNIEINRIVRVIEETGEAPDISIYETITGIFEDTGSNDFFVSVSSYVIRRVNGRLYRIEYKEKSADDGKLYANITVGVFAAFVLGLLLYIRQRVIKPFDVMSDLPRKLAKGTLTAPLKEHKSRYFGKFVWGLDMLREELEKSKRTELELQKEKKTMLMSLSHDIKTPLAAIKLSAKALERGLYTDPEKQRETAAGITAAANDIEKLVNEIMSSGADDIMSFDVKNGEFYLSEVIDRVSAFYREKLSGTEFTVGKYTDCLISGDPDRLTEVLRNIIDNAVKYGDGRYISISFSDEEECRLITVSDSGCTLPENELSHIFDSFRRGTNSAGKEGSGLGLYICRRLMTAMNGDIFAEIKDGEMCVTVVCRKNV